MAEPTPSPVAETGQAARGATAKAGGFLKAKTFGMPRYVFLGLLAVGIAYGLYRRKQNAAADAALSSDPNATDPTLDPSAFDPNSLGANANEAGLAGVGVAGITPAGVVPVQTPQIPEGLPEITTALGQGLVDLAGEFPSAADPPNITVNPPKVVVKTGKGGTGGKGGKGGKGGHKQKKPGSQKKAGATQAHAATGGGPPARRAAAHNPPKRKNRR